MSVSESRLDNSNDHEYLPVLFAELYQQIIKKRPIRLYIEVQSDFEEFIPLKSVPCHMPFMITFNFTIESECVLDVLLKRHRNNLCTFITEFRIKKHTMRFAIHKDINPYLRCTYNLSSSVIL